MIFGLSLVVVVFAGLKLFEIYRDYAAGTDVYSEAAKQFVQMVESKLDSSGQIDETAGLHGTSADGQNKQSGQAKKQIIPTMDPDQVPININFAAMKSQCPDVVGWLYCADTPINYPVVQSGDNDYYLYRLMDGTENKNGTIFMDFRNDAEFGDWNHLIYGHNMKNGAMFGSLTDYMEQEFYERHPFWFLLTEEKNYRIDLVGGYVTPDGSEAYALPKDTAGRDALFQMASRSSVFDADVELMPDDRLITMSTCVYDYEDARFVLVGVLREVGMTETEAVDNGMADG